MRPEIPDYFLQMLKLVASRGTCLRRKVACIITDKKNHVLSTGYNGVPSTFLHCTKQNPCPGAEDEPGNSVRCLAVHAEQNALIQCIDLSRAYFMYCSCTPCFTCAKMVANTSIKMVVCQEVYADRSGIEVLQQANIAVIIVDDPIRDAKYPSDVDKPSA